MVTRIEQTRRKASKIRLVVTDIDGVWTDAKMYYTADGDFMKAFSTYDGYGVQRLREKGIPTAIITGEDSEIVRQRAKKLRIEDVFVGIRDKLPVLEQLMAKYQLQPDNIAYIGDDVNDIACMSLAGFTASPPNSPVISVLNPDMVTERQGGEGAFREFAEVILRYCDGPDK